jgi:predicted TIM-barrel fold metal-dependent hydrolase
LNTITKEADVAVGEDQARRFVVVSTDSHAGAKRLADFEPYVEPAFRERLASLYGASTELRLPGMMYGPVDPEVDEDDPVRRAVIRLMLRWGVPEERVYQCAPHYSVDTIEGGGDFDHRLAVTEEHGVAAEVYNPAPVFDGVIPPLSRLYNAKFRTTLDYDFALAMKHSYNRWLADLCNAAPGRRAGLIQVDFENMEEAIADIRRFRDAGLFGGVSLPVADGQFSLPSYADPDYWEPLWNVLEELAIPAYVHAGGDAPDASAMYGPDPAVAWEAYSYEFWFYARRVFWLLMFGGAFDRHPDLKLVIGENNAGWVPGVLTEMEAHLDIFWHTPSRHKLKMRPTEYFLRHVYIAASVLTRQEVEARHEIGLDNLCWGSDYPHPEGASPLVRSVIKHQVGGLPANEIEKLLGLNALKVWDFDRDAVRKAAERIGPTEEDLRRALSPQEIPANFSGVLAAIPVSLAEHPPRG